MELETHGRWPVVGACALVPASALAVRRETVRPLAFLLWHQTEEWVWPGAFLPWINRTVIGSEQDEFPIDRRIGFLVNVVLGWGISAVAMTGPAAAAPAAALYVSHLGNAGLHLSWAIRHRRYDPGSVTALVLLLPISIGRLRGLWSDPGISRRAVRAGVAAGAMMSASLLPALKWRVRRSTAPAR